MIFNHCTVLLSLSALPLTAHETIDPALIEGILGSGALTEGNTALGIRPALDNGVGNALSNLGRWTSTWAIRL